MWWSLKDKVPSGFSTRCSSRSTSSGRERLWKVAYNKTIRSVWCLFTADLRIDSFTEQLLFTVTESVVVDVQKLGGLAFITFGNFKRCFNIVLFK